MPRGDGLSRNYGENATPWQQGNADSNEMILNDAVC